MNAHMKRLIAEIDKLVKGANPPDGGAPLGPVVQIGCLVNREWDFIKRFMEE